MIVLKVGGASTGGVAAAIAALDEPVCVVHGAGPQISEEMERRGLDVVFVGGRRVTTAAGLEVVRESFAAVSAAVCAAVGPLALPLAGDEIGLEAEQLPELGLVGRPLPCAPAAVLEALAVGIGATRISFLTDVPGVYRDGELVHSIDAHGAQTLVDGGVFDGGIVPKLLAAALAARNGVAADIGVTAVVA